VPEPVYFYLDTDVVSRLADGLLPNLKSMLTSEKCLPVYSSILLSESFGKPKFDAKIGFLDEINAHRIVVEDHESSDAKIYDERASEIRNWASEGNIADGIERVLDRFSLFAHGSKSGPSLRQVSQEFENEILEILEHLFSLSDDLPTETERGLKNLTQYLVRSVKFDGEATSKSNHLEMERYVQNYTSVGSITPPNIVQKISQRLPSSQQGEFLKLFGAKTPNVGKLVETAALLGMVGFNRDKNIGKKESSKSMRAARSDRHDVQHIAYGLVCHAFFTGDRRSARKAFVLAEYFGLGCVIVFVDSGGRVYGVSEKNCP